MEENKLQEEYLQKSKTYKMFMIFGMISIVMIFAGLTSAFIVSKSRKDWLQDFEIPDTFLISTILLLISSLTFWLAKKTIQKGKNSQGMMMLVFTLVLGVLFVIFQFKGFNFLFEKGLVPVGPSGSVTISFLYAFVIVHIAHLFGGFISLLVVIYNHYKQKYKTGQTLGIELSAMYWHFMDFIWLGLFLFFYFFK